MKVNELSKQIGITNKDLISYLKDKGYKISSHMQNVPEEEIDNALNYFTKKPEQEVVEEVKNDIEMVVTQKPNYEPKVFQPDDIIVCKSVTPWKLNALSIDKTRVYHWGGFGDVDYLTFRDLQALRRTDYITKPKIIIQDPDLCYQWRRELGNTYKYYLGIEYPEEFFDKTDSEFEKMLKEAPTVLKDVIKFTAINMIKNENYPTVQKLVIIDELLGTCLKEFI